MYRTARALIIQSPSEKRVEYRNALSELANFGIIAEKVKAGGTVNFDNINVLPDVIILDACNVSDSVKMTDYAQALLSQKTLSVLPIVMVGPSHQFKNFPVDLHLDETQPAHIIAKRLRHIIRLATMKLEYSRRLETAKQFKVNSKAIDFEEENENCRLLVIGKGERYFQLASLFQGKAVLKSVQDLHEAQDLMKKSYFDCLIIDSLADKSFEIDDLKVFKLNARYFSLPVLLLQEGLADTLKAELTETGICDLFDLNDNADELAIYAKTLIKAEKIRQDLITAFKAPIFKEITDKKTGLPERRFFEAHLDRLVLQSQAWNTPIAFGVLETEFPFKTNEVTDEKRRLQILRQVGQMITSLIRAEDIATYFGNGKFIIAAPNTSAITISVLISRIQAVLSSTEFSSGGEPSKITISTNYFESTPKDTLDKIMQGLIDA